MPATTRQSGRAGSAKKPAASKSPASKRTAARKPAAKRATAAKPARKQPDRAKAPGSGRKLVIVESPAKARTIGRYLGKGYVVKASMGHVRDLPRKQFGVDLENDFAPDYELVGGRAKILTELRKYVGAAPTVFLATDLDREGEAIAWHLAEALKLPASKLRRVTFNEITATAIRQAFAEPADIDANKVQAQQARRILDRIVGYQLSPLLWRKVAAGLSAGRVQTVAARLIVERERQIQAFVPEEFWKVSAVFTAQLAAAADLEQQWRALLASAGADGTGPSQAEQYDWLARRGAFRAELVKWQGQKFNCADADAALDLARDLGLKVRNVQRSEDPAAKGPAKHLVRIDAVIDRAADVKFAVAAVGSRTSTNHPPPPFTTASMQQAGSVRLRFSASRTMAIAQQLYEGVDLPDEGGVGLITYMRTDSVNVAAQAVEQARDYIGQTFGQKYLPQTPCVYRSAPRAQAAHEAVRPTDVTRTPASLKEALTGPQWKLYDLIWRRFVACQMSPARWNVVEIDVTARTRAGEGVFKAVGRQLAFDGFLKVAGLTRRDEQLLPDLAEGAAVAAVAIDPAQRFTQPPPRYTEASLVKALEAQGIGRPSTYASIIQTIQDRGYVTQRERRFHATDLGMVVNDKLLKFFPDVFDLRFTARMEDRLDEIEAGREQWVKVLRDFYTPFQRDLAAAGEKMVHAKAETAPSEYACPECGKQMAYRWNKHGRYLACEGYPKCKTTFPVDEDGRKVEPRQVDVVCPECGKPMLVRRGRFGVFLGCSGYPDCRGTLPCDEQGQPLRLVKPEDIKQSCTECGSAMVVRRRGRRAFLACSKYPKCRTTTPLPEGVRLAPTPRVEPESTGVTCPKCRKKELVIRSGRRGKFIACSGFPRCKNTYDVSHLADLKAGKVPDGEKGSADS